MVTTVSQINNLTFTTSFFESTSKRDTSEKFDEMLLSRSMKKKTFTDPLLYHSWDDRLDKIKSMPISWDGKEVCFVDVSVIYNVKDFLDQIDNIFPFKIQIKLDNYFNQLYISIFVSGC